MAKFYEYIKYFLVDRTIADLKQDIKEYRACVAEYQNCKCHCDMVESSLEEKKEYEKIYNMYNKHLTHTFRYSSMPCKINRVLVVLAPVDFSFNVGQPCPNRDNCPNYRRADKDCPFKQFKANAEKQLDLAQNNLIVAKNNKKNFWANKISEYKER